MSLRKPLARGGGRRDSVSLLSYESSFNRVAFERRYNPEFLHDKEGRGTFISLIVCYSFLLLLNCLLLCGGMYFLVYGLLTRSRNVSTYNANVELWTTKYRAQLFNSNSTYSFSWSFDPTHRGETELVPVSYLDPYLPDNPKSIETYKPLSYIYHNMTLARSSSWNSSIASLLKFFSSSTRELGSVIVRPFLEHSVDLSSKKLSKKASENCAKMHGQLDAGNHCLLRWILKGLCGLTNNHVLKNLNGASEGDYGCYAAGPLYDDFDVSGGGGGTGTGFLKTFGNYLVGQYRSILPSEWSGPFEVFGRVELRSTRDPYLLFWDSTESTLLFGSNHGMRFVLGVVLVSVSCYCVYCLVCFYFGLPKQRRSPNKGQSINVVDEAEDRRLDRFVAGEPTDVFT